MTIWLPTMHRIAATENVKHEASCSVCETFPIIGFRYKCMDTLGKDLCQDCFWSGKESSSHKGTHRPEDYKEYCFPTTVGQDAKVGHPPSRVISHLCRLLTHH